VSTNGSGLPDNFEVALPAGGRMHLLNAEEVELWEHSHRRYLEDFQLSKTNDLVLVGAILQQQLVMFRAQRKLNGLEPELDNANVPTGRWIQVELDSNEQAKYQKALRDATGEIRSIEKALGIDKATREAGGAVSVANYLRTLKAAAHDRGIHIVQRTLAYEKFANDFRWRLRVFFNADAEDRAYHNLTPDELLKWCQDELAALEEGDKRWAKERGRLYVGKL
jgi:hypothetical protein